VSNWTTNGYIQILVTPKVRGQKKLVNEADVAYCAAIYHAKAKLYDGQLAGVRIFDENGNPYQTKDPEIAAYKRAHRRRERKKS
jgi:hypothetical protein